MVGECVVNNGDDHFGFSISGADAEYFVAKASWLHRIPEELSFARARSSSRSRSRTAPPWPPAGSTRATTVAVIGGGPIGLLCTLAAATMGGSVTLIEPQAHRRALGLEIGARHAIDPTAGTARRAGRRGDGRPRLRRRDRGGRRSGGDGERVPDRRARRARRLRRHRRRRHRAGEIGLIQSKALQVRGIIGSAGLWPRTIRFMATSGVDPTPLLTATFPLGEGTAALDAARDTSRNVKVQIEC